MEKWKVVLASGSPRRKELLEQVGIVPVVMPSQIEERISTDLPEEAVKELSRQKARDVAGRWGDQVLVLGADTVVSAEGRILGKPASHEAAAQMLWLLQGRTHQVFTGVTMILKLGGKQLEKTFAEKTDVWLYPMSQKEIRAYAASGEPMDKAGAYGIQGKFAAYVKGIEGDYNNVVGLPVGRICQELKMMERLWED